MATLTKILTTATNPVRDYKFFQSGAWYRLMRYEFDVTLVTGDLTADISLGVVSPRILLTSGYVSGIKVAGTGVETTTVKIGTGNAINGNPLHPFVTNAAAISATINTGNNVIGFPASLAATDFYTNGAAGKFLGSFAVDLFAEGLKVILTSSADPTGTGAQIKGYVSLVGLDMSNDNTTI
jgi:hypothetical protein